MARLNKICPVCKKPVARPKRLHPLEAMGTVKIMHRRCLEKDLDRLFQERQERREREASVS